MSYPHLVIARLYEYIEPVDRGNRYEDPLHEVLEAAQAGAVTGGGSQLNESGQIEFADVEIELADLEAAIDLVASTLESAGAPQGSEILHEAKVVREFGRQQCLAVYLDGTSLPDEVYANLDFDDVVTKIGTAAGPDSYRGCWQGPEETGLYFFGSNAEEMFALVEPLLRTLPIGQNARVVIRHGHESLQPRTVRMPRH
ncbi:MAG: hypothetical protein ACM4AI_25110 [Acidobacteriota bacterium]